MFSFQGTNAHDLNIEACSPLKSSPVYDGSVLYSTCTFVRNLNDFDVIKSKRGPRGDVSCWMSATIVSAAILFLFPAWQWKTPWSLQQLQEWSSFSKWNAKLQKWDYCLNKEWSSSLPWLGTFVWLVVTVRAAQHPTQIFVWHLVPLLASLVEINAWFCGFPFVLCEEFVEAWRAKHPMTHKKKNIERKVK